LRRQVFPRKQQVKAARTHIAPSRGAGRMSMGSGLIIDPSGRIVIKNRVVKDAKSLTVTLSNRHS